MESYVFGIQTFLRVSRLHDGSIHLRWRAYFKAGVRVHRGPCLCARNAFHSPQTLGGLALASSRNKESANGSGRHRFDGSIPVRRDSSFPTVESIIFALVPRRIWHWNVQCSAGPALGTSFRSGFSGRLSRPGQSNCPSDTERTHRTYRTTVVQNCQGHLSPSVFSCLARVPCVLLLLRGRIPRWFPSSNSCTNGSSYRARENRLRTSCAENPL